MFTNGYLYALFLFITAFLLSKDGTSDDIALSAFSVFIGVLSLTFEYFKGSIFVKNILNKYF